MGTFSSTIRGMATAAALSAGTLAALPAAAYAGTNTTFVACNNVTGPNGLIAAINAANAAGSGTITLAPGCAYFLTATTGPLPPISGNITLRAKDATIRRVATAATFRIIQITSTGRLSAEGITFAGGDAGSGNNGGGFLVNPGGALRLSWSRVTQNSAQNGGGIFNEVTATARGTVRLFNTVVNSNTSVNFGGGIFSRGDLTVVGGIIGFNTAGFSGGGLHAESGSTAALTATDIVHNSTVNVGTGGGILIRSSANVTVRKSNVQFNTAATGGGIASDGILQVLDSRLSNNRTRAGGSGGALASTFGTATIRNSSLTKNSASIGGAIFEGGGSTVVATKSRITNNDPNNCVPLGAVPGCTG